MTPECGSPGKKRDFSVDAIVCAVVVMSPETEPDPKFKAFKTAEYRTLNEWDS